MPRSIPVRASGGAFAAPLDNVLAGAKDEWARWERKEIRKSRRGRSHVCAKFVRWRAWFFSALARFAPRTSTSAAMPATSSATSASGLAKHRRHEWEAWLRERPRRTGCSMRKIVCSTWGSTGNGYVTLTHPHGRSSRRLNAGVVTLADGIKAAPQRL